MRVDEGSFVQVFKEINKKLAFKLIRVFYFLR